MESQFAVVAHMYENIVTNHGKIFIHWLELVDCCQPVWMPLGVHAHESTQQTSNEGSQHINLALFVNFYKKSYVEGKAKKKGEWHIH